MSTNIKTSLSLLKIFIFLEKHLLCGNFARHRDLLKTSSFYKTNPSANQFNNPQNKINKKERPYYNFKHNKNNPN